ncbi:PREDICTED: uncharacterized protein LOC106807770 [Priapulus caudatus]|uniref:Uncharacterized protein LOC106807770 n=1 Tax=Priapulus caudatus TaxID=37621 RepID=A0ABM1E0I2_PRICU|nr:PREDICTED: uncharacterized protein LOC106807770 [Priapulus caudatus]
MDHDEAMQIEEDADCSHDSGCMLEESVGAPPFFAVQISREEFQRQAKEHTKEALQRLVGSLEFKQMQETCKTCNVCWSLEHISLECAECGGFAIQRPCPICSGRCGQLWTRDIDMSHAMRTAHWQGDCGLPKEQQQVYLYRAMMDDSETAISEALKELNTENCDR